MKLSIYCADIGSVMKGNFGWASMKVNDEGECHIGKDINQLAQNVSNDLNNGWKVSLGFECPLFVPIHDNPEKLTSSRPGEGNRSWSAGAGTGSLAIGLTESLWVLNKVRSLLGEDTKTIIQVFLDWDKFQNVDRGLFIWEAFITGEAKSDSHHGDAEIAIKSFAKGLPTPERNNIIKMGEVKVLSLIGAALLQAEWTKDISFLGKTCLVIGGNKQFNQISIQTQSKGPNQNPVNLSRAIHNCYWCQSKIPIIDERKCPAPGCTKEFYKSWGGIDAHWKSNHTDIMAYDNLYGSICHNHKRWIKNE